MSLLKRLFGTTDAVEDARERAEHDSELAPATVGVACGPVFSTLEYGARS